MYQACYDEVLEDDQAAARRVEFQALDRCVFLLGKAETAGVPSRESIDALYWTVQLWQTFLIELADDGNVLPTELRAKLISIGIWILKQADAIRLGRSRDLAAISGICAIVRDGLR